jgi:hypothetical protein
VLGRTVLARQLQEQTHSPAVTTSERKEAIVGSRLVGLGTIASPAIYAFYVQLLKWQRNALFKAVEAGGLNARECAFEYDDTGARITHRPSGSYFLLEGDPAKYTCTWVIGEGPKWGPLDTFTAFTLDERVQGWATEVRSDVDTPDLWADLQRELGAATDTRFEDVEDTPFTPAEREEIADKLREIKEFAEKTYSLTGAQVDRLAAQLDHIEAASHRIGRKDWLLLFYGVLFNFIVSGLLRPDAAHGIVVMVFQGLAHLFGGVEAPQLPPMGSGGRRL